MDIPATNRRNPKPSKVDNRSQLWSTGGVTPPTTSTLDAIDATKTIDPEIAADIEKFERLLADHLADRVDEDAFRVFRLNNGIYGQRQGGHNQMVRVKVPYGSLDPEQLEMLAHIADTY